MWCFWLFKFLVGFTILQASVLSSDFEEPQVANNTDKAINCLEQHKVGIENCQEREHDADINCTLLLSTLNCIQNELLFTCGDKPLEILYRTFKSPISREEIERDTDDCYSYFAILKSFNFNGSNYTDEVYSTSSTDPEPSTTVGSWTWTTDSELSTTSNKSNIVSSATTLNGFYWLTFCAALALIVQIFYD